jgi:predicted lipoprotein with Yx(FWY)xxD motif
MASRAATRRGIWVALSFAAVALVTSSCAASSASAGHPPATLDVAISHTSAGATLVDASGWTLYAFSGDHGSTIGCTASDCLSFWPPLVLASGQTLKAGPGVTGTLTTITRPDGSQQVSYNGLPVYTYKGDGGPGQLLGNGVAGHYGSVSGTWSAVTSSSGAPAASPANGSSSSTTTTTSQVPASSGHQNTGTSNTQLPAPTTTRAPATTTTTQAPTTTTTTTTTMPSHWS